MKIRLALAFFLLLIILFDITIWFYSVICILFNNDRATQIVLAYDRLGNVAMGQGNETISSWAGRHNSWLERPINYLFKIINNEDNHCDSHLER